VAKRKEKNGILKFPMCRGGQHDKRKIIRVPACRRLVRSIRNKIIK
jgi:hypothetical protein